MNATRRRSKRVANDDYKTPVALCYQIARQLHREGFLTDGLRVLEPCAGDGRLLEACAYFATDLETCCVEVNRKYASSLRALSGDVSLADFRRWSPPLGSRFDLVITNPPFLLAEDIILRALPLLSPQGVGVFLLRQNFVSGQERNQTFWSRVEYSRLYVCSQRPSFMSRACDSTDYAWFMFPKQTLRERKPVYSYETCPCEVSRSVTVVHLPPTKGLSAKYPRLSGELTHGNA